MTTIRAMRESDFGWVLIGLAGTVLTVVGISVMPAVLSTRNMIIGLLAVSLCGLISCT